MDNPLDNSFEPSYHAAKRYRRQSRDYDLSLLGAPPAGLESRPPSVTWRSVSGHTHAATPPPPDFGACSPDPDDDGNSEGDDGNSDDPVGTWRGLWNCCGAVGLMTLLYWATVGTLALIALLKGH